MIRLTLDFKSPMHHEGDQWGSDAQRSMKEMLHGRSMCQRWLLHFAIAGGTSLLRLNCRVPLKAM